MTTAPAIVKERPILFSGPMVRALLAGTKTQTRRLVKPQPTTDRPIVAVAHDGVWLCPYGRPGDRLWVRETWMHLAHATELGPGSPIGYRADIDACGQIPVSGVWRNTHHYPWKPSIFMPRWACRIVLELTDVRVQRLRSIKLDDCLAEGVSIDVSDVVERFQPAMRTVRAINAYRSLWESINGKGSWRANPWVWVLTFKRLTPVPSITSSTDPLRSSP